MKTENFFEEPNEQSLVKITIVQKYFWAWANVVLPTVKRNNLKMAYIDLFSGPGRYNDGTPSTPLLILEKAIKHEELRKYLVTIFNDRDKNNTQTLERLIHELGGINQLRYQPRISTMEVGEEIEKIFKNMRFVPTLLFVDPWGYKGLSLGLINSVLKDWGCDCVFFFNFNRINMGLNNEKVKDHMDSLFGNIKADKLRDKLCHMDPNDREPVILESLVEGFQSSSNDDLFILPFCFKNKHGTRTKHYLIFVTKHFRGYEIMKEIMAKESTGSCQGVASFVYCEADKNQPFLFELTKPLAELENMLLEEYSGKTTYLEDIYMKHSIGKNFIKRNYQTALKNLEELGKIITIPPKEKRRKGTFSNNVKIIFPERK